MHIRYIFILILVTVAMTFDLRTYKIPNVVNGIGCLIGIGINLIQSGLWGLSYSLLGIAIPVVFLIVLFGFKVIGAGDIKLLSAVGSSISVEIIQIIIISFIITALYGLICCIIRLICKRSVKGFTRIHLSVPIAVGTFLYVAGGVLT